MVLPRALTPATAGTCLFVDCGELGELAQVRRPHLDAQHQLGFVFTSSGAASGLVPPASSSAPARAPGHGFDAGPRGACSPARPVARGPSSRRSTMARPATRASIE